MFSHKDIEYRSIYVITCLNKRDLRVSNGELLLEDTKNKKVLTKIPFPKVLILFVIGHIRITTPLIEKCQDHNVALVVTKLTLRPVFYWANSAEANFLLRKQQYTQVGCNMAIARRLVCNKLMNQISLLQRTRRNDDATQKTIAYCRLSMEHATAHSETLTELMALEGRTSKLFFKAYFQDYNWRGRKPRAKCDYINVVLDIGYTYLFNFMECFVRMFGFDVYAGVYHQLWFKRKSLVCDLIEPFRCIIDHTIRTGLNRKQIIVDDFEYLDDKWQLKHEHIQDYGRLFFDSLILHKVEIFRYVQQYYRAFMREKSMDEYPLFEI